MATERSFVEYVQAQSGKLYFRIDEQMEDRDLLKRLFEITAGALPLPAPKRDRAAASVKRRREVDAR